jgi:hypothetical protein
MNDDQPSPLIGPLFPVFCPWPAELDGSSASLLAPVNCSRRTAACYWADRSAALLHGGQAATRQECYSTVTFIPPTRLATKV